MEETNEAFMKYYSGIYGIDFTVYGIFPAERPELEKRFFQDVYRYVESANPLTKEIYSDMTAEQKDDAVKGNPVWTMTNGMGLWLISGGKAQKRISGIIKEYRGFAKQLAREARKREGWKDDGSGSYKITPDGKRNSSNGFPIGDYAMPWGDDDAGPFDGTITDETKFTK